MAHDVFGIVGSLQAEVFRVTSVVAEGGFGVVYQAHHRGFRADVALKCLKVPEGMSDGQQETFLEKFREEGELLFRLSALIPNVVRPLHIGVLENAAGKFVPFIALEWLDGESLDTLIAKRRGSGKSPFDLQRVMRLLGPVARALECAHEFPGPNGPMSILHRDLKPENLFLARVHGREIVKILDFGIGTVKSAATQIAGRVSQDQSMMSAFTPAYGAPEQWLPKRFGQTGTWTDVWGFALCVVEAITGSAPIEGDAAEVMGACIDVKRRPTPRNMGVSVPESLERALLRALAVDPRERYADIGKFWDDVEGPLGISTPRIAVNVALALESIPPPGSILPLAAQIVPELELQSVHEEPTVRAHVASRRAVEQLSILGNDAVEPASAEFSRLSGAGPPVSGRGALRPVRARAPLPERVSVRVAARIVGSLRSALTLIGVGVAVMIADFAVAYVSGSALSLGPVRAFWIAGPLVALGIVRIVITLVSSA